MQDPELIADPIQRIVFGVKEPTTRRNVTIPVQDAKRADKVRQKIQQRADDANADVRITFAHVVSIAVCGLLEAIEGEERANREMTERDDGITGIAKAVRDAGEHPADETPKQRARVDLMGDEGWGVIRPGDRVAHYYREGFSLCRRVGFYRGDLSPDEYASPDDCKACRRKLEAEKAKAK